MPWKGLSSALHLIRTEHLPNTGPTASKNLTPASYTAIMWMTSSHQVPLLCLPSLGVEKRYMQVSKRALTPAEPKSNKKVNLVWKERCSAGGGCPWNLVEKTVGLTMGSYGKTSGQVSNKQAPPAESWSGHKSWARALSSSNENSPPSHPSFLLYLSSFIAFFISRALLNTWSHQLIPYF